MALKQFTDGDGYPLYIESVAVIRVWHYTPPPPPDPPSPLSSCVALNNGTGVYVQESVEKVYAILTE